MKKSDFIIIPLAALIAILMGCTKNSALCADSSLSCGINSFSELYQKDYDQFWNIFNSAGKEAVKCSSAQQTARFLEVASVKEGNAEFTEYFMELVENEIILKNPECFLDAISLISPDARTVIFNDLRTPLFNEKQAIDNALMPYRNTPKYQELLELYQSSP